MHNTGNSSTFIRIIAFFLCSLATIGMFLALQIPIFMISNNMVDAMGMTNDESRTMLSNIILSFLTFGSVIPLYFIYFSEDQMSEVKKFYKDNTKERIDYKLLLSGFMKEFGIKEMILILAYMIAALIAFFAVPEGGGLIFVSVAFIYLILPKLPFAAFVLSVIWSMICYLLCLWIKTRKWERERIDKSKI